MATQILLGFHDPIWLAHIFPDGLVQPPPSYPFSHNHGSVKNHPKWNFRNFHIGRYIHFPSKKPWFWRILILSPIYSLGFQDSLWLSGGMTIFQIYNQPRIPWIWGQFRRCRSLHHAVGLPGGVSTWLVRLVGGKDVWGRNVGWCDHQRLNEKKTLKLRLCPWRVAETGDH